MNREFITYIIGCVNNVLAFFMFIKYCDFNLVRKRNKARQNLYFFCILLSQIIIGHINSNFFIVFIAISYYIYIKINYIVLVKNSILYVISFNILYNIITVIIFSSTTFVVDFLSGSMDLLNNNFYQDLKGILLNTILYIAFSLVYYTKKYRNKNLINPYKKYIYLLMLMIIFILSSFVIYIVSLNSSKFILENITIMIFILNIVMIVILLTIHEKIIDFLQESALEELKLQKYELTQSYYDSLSEKSKQLSSLRHDFKNHLGIIQGRLEQENYEDAIHYLKSVTEYSQKASDLIITNSPIISSILQVKKSECERKNISLEVQLAFDNIYKINDMDLIIILGNILDNAIEATNKDQIKDKYISLTINQVNTYLAIQCANPYVTKPLIINEQLVTTKTQKDFHGMGLANITESCSKYHGECTYTFDCSIFTINVLLPNY